MQPPGDVTSPSALSDVIAEAHALFSEMAGGTPHHFRFGPAEIAVELRAGSGRDTVADAFFGRILHARVNAPGDAAPAFSVRVLGLGGVLPPALDALTRSLPADLETMRLTDGNGLEAYWMPRGGVLDMIDRKGGAAVTLIAAAERVPGWYWGSPLRHLIYAACLPTPAFVAHGAGLSRGGDGLLLTGASGAGKSTLTAWCLDAGLSSIGDDIVMIAPGEARPPTGIALYDNFKVAAPMRRTLSYAGRVAWSDVGHYDKRMTPISAVDDGAFLPSLPVAAIVVPSVSGRLASRFSRAQPIEGVRAMAASTQFLFPGGDRETVPKILSLVRSRPVYRLETGTDPAGAVAAVEAILEEVGG